MNKKRKIIVLALLVAALIAALVWYLHSQNVAVLAPKGTIGSQERRLMVFTVALGLLVIVPVFVMAGVIAWKYREGNSRKVRYTPDWDSHRLAEITWWGIPIVIITILSVVTWVSSHQLDPWKPLASHAQPLNIQVVSLDWRWLFIYPDQNIASVNSFEIPLGTPINFKITSDTVMNSFWLPNLGGQIYAMPGMSTQLHLEASKAGDYRGNSANISGSGFAGMVFTAHAGSEGDFDTWVNKVRKSPLQLSSAEYEKLAAPSKSEKPLYYATVEKDLYSNLVMKYMMPGSNHPAPANHSPSKMMPKNMNMPGMKM